MRVLLLSAVTVLCLAAPSPRTQIQPDQGVFSAIEFSKLSPGVYGGLGVFDPRTPNKWNPILGLPRDLTGAGFGEHIGSFSVLVRSSDGAVVVGEMAPANYSSVDIHLLHLSGRKVARSQVFQVGPPSGVGTIDDMAWLPDGRVLFAYSNVKRTPASGLAILDLGTGGITTVARIPAGRVSPRIAVTRDGATAYASVDHYVAQRFQGSEVHAIQIPSGTTTTYLTGWPGLSDIDIDNDGKILLCEALLGWIHRVDIATKKVVATYGSLLPLRGIEVDRLTGNILAAGRGPARVWGLFTVVPRHVGATLVTNFPKTGPLSSGAHGYVTGLALNHAVVPYGRSFPGKNRYDWKVHPGPFPRVGSKSFRIGVTASPGPSTGVVFLSADRGNAPTPFAFRLLLDVTTLFHLTTVVATQKGGWIPFAIPANPQLKGLRLCLQSIHPEASTLVATRGLQITIL